MSLNTLTPKVAGDVIVHTDFNDIHQALRDEFVGRNASNAPVAGNSLGTSVYPWGPAYVESLTVDGSLINFANLLGSNYKIISGAKRTVSQQPQFIQPSGSGGSCSILGGTTPLRYSAKGTEATISSNLFVSGLTLATAATTTFNNANATGGAVTRLFGSTWLRNESIPNFGLNSTIIPAAQVGRIACVRVGTVPNEEYVIGFAQQQDLLVGCRRGFAFDTGLLPKKAITLTNGVTAVALMQINWLYADIDGSVYFSTTSPIYSDVAPSSPVTNDYWYSTTDNTWSRYDGSSFIEVNRVPVGMVICDTANAVAARSFDFDNVYYSDCGIRLSAFGSAAVKGDAIGSTISVNGVSVRLDGGVPTWSMATNLATSSEMISATEQASTYYYFYIDEFGKRIISDIAPDKRGDLKGLYHPSNPWRCVGWQFNDASSNLISTPVSILEDEQIPRESLGPVNIVSSGTLSLTSTSAAEVQVPGSSLSINCTGRPLRISLRSFNTASPSGIIVDNTANTAAISASVRIRRAGTSIWRYDYAFTGSGNSVAWNFTMPAAVCVVDTPGVGAHTYDVALATITASTQIILQNMQLVIEEMA